MADDFTTGYEKWMATSVRSFAEAWFRILRNLFIVSLLSYVDNKSTYPAMKLFSLFTSILFGVYCMTYVGPITPMSSNSSKRYLRWAGNLLIAAFFVWMFYVWSNIVIKVIDEVTRIQH